LLNVAFKHSISNFSVYDPKPDGYVGYGVCVAIAYEVFVTVVREGVPVGDAVELSAGGATGDATRGVVDVAAGCAAGVATNAATVVFLYVTSGNIL
jgi:hypothetical protein